MFKLIPDYFESFFSNFSADLGKILASNGIFFQYLKKMQISCVFFIMSNMCLECRGTPYLKQTSLAKWLSVHIRT